MTMKMRRISNVLVFFVLAAALSVAACGEHDDSGQTNNDDKNTTATPDDVDAPLEDTAAAWYDQSPENDQLPEEAKADETFPDQFDLVDEQSPVKSQGSRGVCSIFSTVALMEHLYILNEDIPDPDFSEQYLQWSAKNEVGLFTDSSGSTAQVNLNAISSYGIVEETDWAYESQPWGPSDDEECADDPKPTRCHTNGDPPEEAQDAPKWSLPSGKWISTRTRDIKAHMRNEGQAVIVGGDFFYQAWNHSGSQLPTSNEYWREGYVQYPNEEDRETSLENRAGHSFLLVGWDDDLEIERLDGDGEVMTDENGDVVTEKGFFIFKNSWGTGSFGVNNPHGDGYGFISYDYVENHLRGRTSDIPTEEHVPGEVIGDGNNGDNNDENNDLECSSDELACDGQCVANDEQNCGECGNTCESGEVCEANTCQAGEPDVYTYEYAGDPQPVPNNSSSGITTTVEVDRPGEIQAMVVDVFIEHTRNGFLQIDLTHPDGTQVSLYEPDGTFGYDVDEVFDVEEFDGLDAEGTWELTVSQPYDYDEEGSVEEWSLEILH